MRRHGGRVRLRPAVLRPDDRGRRGGLPPGRRHPPPLPKTAWGTPTGGLTEFLRAAALAQSHGLEVSAHCAPHAHAAVAAAIPNLRHIEWFHDHVRIESMFFDATLDPTGGEVRPDDRGAGHGLTLRREEMEQYRVA